MSWFKEEYSEKIWEKYIKHLLTEEIVRWLVASHISPSKHKWGNFFSLGESEWCRLYLKNVMDKSVTIQEVLNAIDALYGKDKRKSVSYIGFPLVYVQ